MADGATPNEARCRMTPEGWRCPSCGAVYAPWMAKCSTCPIKVVRSGHTITITPQYPPDPECDHDWLAWADGPATCGKCGAALPEAGAPR
jgi:hypothetical protein